MKTTTEQIVLRSKRNGVMIHQFESIPAAQEWADKWRARHGNTAPEAVIARVTITREEEELSNV